MTTETTRERIARLEAELQQAVIDKDHITYLEASGNLKVELVKMEDEINLNVVQMFLAARRVDTIAILAEKASKHLS